METAPRTAAVGVSTPRIDGPEKLRGQATYVADVRLPASLSARLVLSTHAHARIEGIDLAPALARPGVVAAFAGADLPEAGLFAVGETYHVGEPLAVVVAESDEAAEDGAEAVRVAYAPLPVVVDPVRAMAPDSPLTRADEGTADALAGAHGAVVDSAGPARPKPRNVQQVTEFRRGDIEKAWRDADVVLEDTYRIARVHQGYLETQGSVARRLPRAGVEVFTSTQSPFDAAQETARALGLDEADVRVHAATIGGGFGGKFPLLEPLAAALARRLGRPVRVILDRMQDFLVTHPAPEAIIRLKMGVKRDGTLTGLEGELVFDEGVSGSDAGFACRLIGSLYRVPHLSLVGYDVRTHKASVGAYRGPDAPQAMFALESHIDRLARAVGMDPIEFRLRNAVEEGDPDPTGRPWPRTGLRECLERLRRHPLWRARDRMGPDEGVGVALGFWPGGLQPAAAACRLNADGSVSVQVGAVDLTGSHTAFALIAAEALGVPAAGVRVHMGDTQSAPFAGAAGGSKTIYTVGAAVVEAAKDLRRQVLAVAADLLEAAPEDLEWEGERIHVRGVPAKAVTLAQIGRAGERFGGKHPPLHGSGRTAITKAAYGVAAHLAKVRVDRETGQVRVVGYVAAQDVGRAINPAEVEGQVRGGVAQGIGRALYEAMRHDDSGQPLNPTLADYGLPTAADLPDIEVELVEVPSELGPFGARGVGEPPAIPGPAAVANAVEDAVGVRLTQAPIRPDAVVSALATVAESA
ncbi:MAG: xanthine dehydrogenase family protein molybdopterin-binding subunit [Firmicutes bacterium]|nr:xanthine dehydrogenase family protein molybdopterin-binding subunit [Bacillota bacterium]